MKPTLWVVSMAGVLLCAAGPAVAVDQERSQLRVAQEAQEQEMIYGSQLMTEQERLEYREKMRAAKTQEEREQIRSAHHAQMKVRAKEQGVTIPDEPPARPGGGMMGPGPGAGGGGRR